MANYCSMYRTNYFSVTDVERLEEIMKLCHSESGVTLFSDRSGEKFGFYCESGLLGIIDDEDAEPAYDNLVNELQKILPDGEAIFIVEIGNEKMRCLVGACMIITKNETKHIEIKDVALNIARDMLGNPDFTTQMDY